ncbi:MAG: M24 family metallopeptidase [Nitrospirales bacterium]|nr:M24 family metallopeptidase [Nitrospirales bacterium]
MLLTPQESRTRIAALRGELQRRNLTGFIIPHADEYHNEYLPPCAERLAWLTGFTGSAGLAVVLQDEAALFVDGRYTLQAGTQVDPELFLLRHLTQSPVHEWLSTVLKPGQTLGYDPWLHTETDVEHLREACAEAGGELSSCSSNPLDAVWIDRPAAPTAMVVSHNVQYAGTSSEEKRKALARQLQADGIDVAVLTAPDSIAWLLNIRGGDVAHSPLPLGFALLHSDGAVGVFLDPRKVSAKLSDHLGAEVTIHGLNTFPTTLDELGACQARVLCDTRRSAAWILHRLTLAGALLVKGDDPCVLPKACKNPIEVHGAREAHRRDGAAMCRFLAWLGRENPKGEITEILAQEYLERCRQESPLWQDASFPTISGAGANGAIVHYRSTARTNKKLEPGKLYLVDSGGQYLDGTTDITRTLAIGLPTSEQKDRYTRVLQGHIALASVRFPKGTTGGQLDALARMPLWEVGLDYDHGTGHGVGSYLNVHEGPQRIAKRLDDVPLHPGMILSNEPGYYKTGEYGIRIENLMVVVPCQDMPQEDREWLSFETLTLVPLDHTLIDRSLLAAHEIEWINRYHRRVCQVLLPLVDQCTAEWLTDATQLL